MKYKIQGDNMPVVICALEDGESIVCEAGAMSWMSPNMKMETKGALGANNSMMVTEFKENLKLPANTFAIPAKVKKVK